jgi:flavodoxin long chain
MSKIGLFYGSSTSQTEYVAYDLQETLNKIQAGLVTIHNIGEATADQINAYDYLIFGIPTWDIGELQEDWDFFWDNLEDVDFPGKKVAIFGLGDQYGYPDTFQDAVGILAEQVMAQGGQLVGFWSTEGYEFEASLALTEDEQSFMGLALDEDNQSDLTAQRVQEWSQQILTEFGLLEKAAAQ